MEEIEKGEQEALIVAQTREKVVEKKKVAVIVGIVF